MQTRMRNHGIPTAMHAWTAAYSFARIHSHGIRTGCDRVASATRRGRRARKDPMAPRRPTRATNGWRKCIRRGAFAPRRMALRAATGARKWRPSVVVFFQTLGTGIRVEQVVELVWLVSLHDQQPPL